MPTAGSKPSWYHQTAVVLLALIFCAPIGLALLWLAPPWSRHSKLAASIFAVIWFGYVVGKTRSSAPEREPTSRAVEKRSGTRALPVKTGDPRATIAAGPTVEDVNAKLVATEPRLLLPAHLSGYRTLHASLNREGVGANAQYDSAEIAGLLAFIAHDVRPDALPTPGKNEKLIKVGEHDALLIDAPAESSVSVIWRTGAWGLSIEIRNTKPALHAAALKAAPKVAEEAARWADMWLAGSPMPDDSMRAQHLLALDNANKAAKEADAEAQIAFETKRKQKALNDFVTTLRQRGVTGASVARVDLNRLDVNTLDVTVSDDWEKQPKPNRLRAAQGLWKLWAQLNTPVDLDKSHIKLIDTAGNKVGGSGIAGSSISVR